MVLNISGIQLPVALDLVALVVAGSMAFGLSGMVLEKSPVPRKPGQANIVEIALALTSGPLQEFDHLLSAATCDYFNGAIVSRLSGADKYALFAPTDAAFEELQRSLGITTPLSELTCALPQDVLFNVLAHHDTDGRVFSHSVFNTRSSEMVEMLNGQYIVTNSSRVVSGRHVCLS